MIDDKVQEQFEEMKAAFDKLADDNKKLADQLVALKAEHEALKTNYDQTVEKTNRRVTDLEDVKAGTRLNTVETNLTNLTKTVQDRTSALSAGGTVIDMGISRFCFQPDGNAVIYGKTSNRAHWASGTDRKN